MRLISQLSSTTLYVHRNLYTDRLKDTDEKISKLQQLVHDLAESVKLTQIHSLQSPSLPLESAGASGTPSRSP